MDLIDKIRGRQSYIEKDSVLSDYENSIAKIIMLCIEDLPFSVGVSKVTQLLRGHQTIFLTEYEFLNNRMFGRLQQFSKAELTYIIKMLAIHRYIVVHEELNVFEVVSVSPKGYSVLAGRRKLDFHFLDTITESHVFYIEEEDLKFVHALKEYRIERALKDNVNSYDICSDVDLMRIANARPTTITQLEAIDDLDSEFIEKYGNDFVEIIWKVIKGKDTAN